MDACKTVNTCPISVPGDSVLQTTKQKMRDMCVTKQGDENLIVTCQNNDWLYAHNTQTNKIQWDKGQLNQKCLSPNSITVTKHGHMFLVNHERDWIDILCADGRYMGNLMSLRGARFLRWNDNTSSLVVAQYKDNVRYDKYHQKWTISVFKID